MGWVRIQFRQDIACSSDRLPSFSSNAGWASTDPHGPYTSGGATGYYEDHLRPDGHGGYDNAGVSVVLDLGVLGPRSSLTFTLYYGAAPDESTAIAATTSVGAQVYALGQPTTPDGPATGSPATGIFIIDGSEYP